MSEVIVFVKQGIVRRDYTDGVHQRTHEQARRAAEVARRVEQLLQRLPGGGQPTLTKPGDAR